VGLLLELTDERASQDEDVEPSIDELLWGSDATDFDYSVEDEAQDEDDPATSVSAESARKPRKYRARRKLADIPLAEAWHAVDAAIHIQHRCAGGWKCWVCNRWSPKPFEDALRPKGGGEPGLCTGNGATASVSLGPLATGWPTGKQERRA
jgi:hypothetical protein